MEQEKLNINNVNLRDTKANDFYAQEGSRNKIEFLLRYAVLSPSTHNSQPWKFKIEESYCSIYQDLDKYKIIEGDPKQRDLFISLGCLIENFEIAAKFFKVFEKTEVYPDTTPDKPVAKVFFSNLESASQKNQEVSLLPQLEAIIKRYNARGLFSKQPLSNEQIEKLQNLAVNSPIKLSLVKDKKDIEELADATMKGLEEAYHSKTFREEMANWVNHNLSKKKEGIPGFSLRLPLPLSFVFASLMRKKDIGSRVGRLNHISMKSSPLIAIMSSETSNKSTWLETGRLAERIMLTAFSEGLRTSIFVAAIEIGDHYKTVQKVIESRSEPQLLMCIGYMGNKQKLNYRHAPKDKLIN